MGAPRRQRRSVDQKTVAKWKARTSVADRPTGPKEPKSTVLSGDLLRTRDRIIKSFPEVASVYCNAGRAETATDPAPTEMFKTVVNLKPKEQWPSGMTIESLQADLDKALQFPGISNAWTMPIKARTDMLATGIRTPVGIKVLGKDLGEMEKAAREIEAVVRKVPGTSSAYAERVIGGYYLEIFPTVTRSRATA